MRKVRRTLAGMVMLALVATTGGHTAMPVRAADVDLPISASPAIGPGLVTGPEAREAFEALARDGAVAFTDFESVPTGPLLKLQLGGPGKDITARMRTTEFRYPLPPEQAPKDTSVLVLPYDFVSEPANHRLMGSNPGDIPDGQAKYELVLSDPVSHAGLLRRWNTNSLTRFYDADGTLLAEHRNTENHEFVGYVAHGPGDRVRTIEFDGVPEQPGNKSNKIFQVGEVDDLYLGNASARSGIGGEEELSPLDEPSIDESGEVSAPSAVEGQAALGAGQANANPPLLTAVNIALVVIVVVGALVGGVGVDYVAARPGDLLEAVFELLFKLSP